jgi:hypothetical protein
VCSSDLVTRKVTGRTSAWFCFVTEDKSNFCHKHFNLGEEFEQKRKKGTKPFGP